MFRKGAVPRSISSSCIYINWLIQIEETGKRSLQLKRRLETKETGDSDSRERKPKFPAVVAVSRITPRTTRRARTEASGSFRRDAATRCYSSDSFSSHRARDSSVCQSPGGFWVLFSCCYEKVGGASCGCFSSAKAVIVTLCCSGFRHDAVAFISCQSSTHLVVRQA